jgi:protease IV
MKQFLITMAGVFAGLVIFVIGVPVLLVAVAAGAARPPTLPAKAVLQLDLRDPLTDQEPSNPLAGIGRRSSSVMSIIETLHRAERDDSVKGLLVRMPEGGVEPAAADELRLAMLRFRAAGKPILAHSQGLYPSGVVTSTYMLGSASGDFWMQPGASLQVTGLASEEVFFKRLFDKYGVEADFEQRYEYKNAVNPFLHEDFTPAHRLAQLSWMSSVYQSALAHAAADRKLAPAALRASLEAGPYVAEDALATARNWWTSTTIGAVVGPTRKTADAGRRSPSSRPRGRSSPAAAAAAIRSAAAGRSIPTTWPRRSTRPPRTTT